MKNTTLLSVASCLIATCFIGVAAQGCGDDDSGVTNKPDTGLNPDTAVPETDGSMGETSTTNPAPPTLGTQIDRMGRPTINTALNHTFDTNTAAGGTKDMAKDAYNSDSNIAGWTAAYIGETSKNLAILDSLDTTCGNGLFSDYDASHTWNPVANYGTLGGVAADDRLWIKTDATTCTVYLAVEAQATGLVPNADCGGRSLGFDVVDITYSAAAIGATTGVTDGIDADPAKTGGTTFPYLAAPTQ